jgi:hypothetical protein
MSPKCSSDRSVCAPQYRSAGTWTTPIESDSRRCPLAPIPTGMSRTKGSSLMLPPKHTRQDSGLSPATTKVKVKPRSSPNECLSLPPAPAIL